MAIAVLYPRYDHPAIEERYASWQTKMLLQRGEDTGPFISYDRDELAADVASDADTEFVLVITDPLLLPSKRFAVRLAEALLASGADAVLPVSNEGQNPAQRRGPVTPYLTLRELQTSIEEIAATPRELNRIRWDHSDPAAYLCRTELLRDIEKPLHVALEGHEVAIVSNEYMHRWTSLRGQTRYDLLERISTDAKSILEFGCGEAPLGEALKRRQKCRVVGIELDPDAAAIAEKRIDAVYRGNVLEIIEILDEKFDWIIGGDIVEHLDEPWSFLGELRRIALPGAHLLLSLPNLANASVVSDLLRGRFDYVYMGLTCVGHVRFFTKQTIEDMLTIAGWEVVEIAPQELVATPVRDQLLHALDQGGVAYSREDLVPTGYYVIARNS
ncbi:MAG: class I SAM-dependent methyltransferase [Thermoanaerobaculia bacterium]